MTGSNTGHGVSFTELTSNHSTKRGNTRRTIGTAAAVAVCGLLEQRAFANNSNQIWTNTSGNNLWSNSANWSPAVVPNNGTGGFTDYNVSIGMPSPCVLTSLNPTIDNLTMNSGGVLDIQYGSALQVNGPTLTDNGSIVVNSNSGGVLANIVFNANTAINGSGTILLTQQNYAYLNAGSGITVTQAAAHTIGGYGILSMGFINNGTVNANTPGQTLSLATFNMSNNLMFEATGGGALSISGITVSQGPSGQINAATGSLVTVSGATTISGGTLNSAGSGAIQISGTDTIANVTNNGVVTIPYGNTLNVIGNLPDNGTIVVNSNQGGVVAALNFSGGTLSGTGTVMLQEPSIYAQLNGTLTQAVGHTISGYGQINATLTNSGIVNANIPGNVLYIESPTVINSNVMEAMAGGGLYFDNAVAVNNSGGTLNASGGGITLANGTSITGGTLTSSASSVYTLSVYNSTVGYSAKLNAVSITSGTEIDIPYGNTLAVTGSTVTNNGLLVVNSNQAGVTAEVIFTANTMLTGTGTMRLQEPSVYAILATGAGDTVTQDIHHSTTGYGEISAMLINNNIVNANVAGQTLYLDTNGKTNNQTFEATNGGTLNISGIVVGQGTSGTVLAANASSVLLTAASVNGGTLSTSGSGYFQIAGSANSTISNVTSNAIIDLPYYNALTVTGVW